MSLEIFDELADWWISKHTLAKNPAIETAIVSALLELGIIGEDETILSRRIVQDWQESEDVYSAVVAVDTEGPSHVRTVLLAAYAVITPPPLPIDERIAIWQKRIEKLGEVGVTIPHWFLIWKGTIYTDYPPHNLFQYLEENTLTNDETNLMASSLAKTLVGLAKLKLNPLALSHSLRTDSLQVFYCGMGFDAGDSGSVSSDQLLKDYESELFAQLPESFVMDYKKEKHDLSLKEVS